MTTSAAIVDALAGLVLPIVLAVALWASGILRRTK